MAKSVFYESIDELAALVPDGAKIAVLKNQTGVPAALFRALVRHGSRKLHLVGVPTTGYVADLLIGCGAISVIETSAVTLDEIGMAPRFIEAVTHGEIAIKDATCPAIYSGLRAGEKGIPFIPIRGLIGSDILAHRDDYKIIDNPFAESDPIVVIPAICPDYALIHVQLVDELGNVYLGPHRDMGLMAHASKHCLVTTEGIFAGNLLEDPVMAAATMSSIYISGVTVVEKGAWPHGLANCYGADYEHQRYYRRKAKTREGFKEYLEEFVYDENVVAV
ncbi:MAG: CoA transferase subunit A [Gammaproteobacteria bacterium]